MPLFRSFVGRKLEDFERMSIRILEVEGTDAGGILIPIWKTLRS